MIKKIIIEVGNVEISLSKEQAIELKKDLNDLLEPAPIYPYYPFIAPTIDLDWWKRPVTSTGLTFQ